MLFWKVESNGQRTPSLETQSFHAASVLQAIITCYGGKMTWHEEFPSRPKALDTPGQVTCNAKDV